MVTFYHIYPPFSCIFLFFFVQGEQMWGDHFLLPLRDMLGETCNNREVGVGVGCSTIIDHTDDRHTTYCVMCNGCEELKGT